VRRRLHRSSAPRRLRSAGAGARARLTVAKQPPFDMVREHSVSSILKKLVGCCVGLACYTVGHVLGAPLLSAPSGSYPHPLLAAQDGHRTPPARQAEVDQQCVLRSQRRMILSMTAQYMIFEG
jgi:hypothetical protein